MGINHIDMDELIAKLLGTFIATCAKPSPPPLAKETKEGEILLESLLKQ
jgi:hypothetical protein